ncbi:MAG: DUF1289 domain-containing protein [Gammaproteobacteria bacterium]|nr:DUF1289 domain-containing protein [Gammaproteobacteria bacterium]
MDIEANIDGAGEDRKVRPLSPCILICTLDDNKRCLGCGRSLQQIAGWARMSIDEQWAVVDELAALPRSIDGTIAPTNGD